MFEFEEISVTLPDGYEAYARYWCPPKLRGAVLYHHGIQSHCGWYEMSARRLAQAGFAVLQVDRRGCGRNERDRGHAESADQLIADALCGRDELARRCGFPDHHVIGVSWGGRLAVSAYVTDSAGVVSLSLVTPGLFPLVGVSREVMSEIGQAMIYEPEKLFDIPLGSAELFTSNGNWQRFIDTDGLTLRQATAGFYLASRRMDKIIAKLAQSRELPVHLLIAGDERIVDNDQTIEFVRKLDWPNNRVSTYADLRHSLEVEGDPEMYYRDLVAFAMDFSKTATRPDNA